MSPVSRARRRLSLLLFDERGMALPTALFAMIATFGLATAAVLSSVDAQQGSRSDSGRKAAIAAADAGANVALLRLNRFQGNLNESTRCVGPSGESQLPDAEGWCPPTAPENLSNGGASFTYQVIAFNEESHVLKVVSVGNAGSVSRRIEVGLVSYGGSSIFADENLIGQDLIDVRGNPDIRTNIGTNGDVHGVGSYEICGNIRHGIGKVAPEPDCDGEILEGNKDLPPIAPPENIATVNSNCRLVPNCLSPTDVDTYVAESGKGNGNGGHVPASPWNPATRTLEIGRNATLTMGGSDYLVCKLVINGGGELIMDANARVRIFVDTPENCGYSDGVVQVDIHGGAEIKSTAYAQGEDAVPGIYVLGSEDIQTNVVLAGTPGGNDGGIHELLLYAPNSDIELLGDTTWKGMIAGKSITIKGNPTIESLPGVEDEEITTSSLWERTRYVECTGPSARPPDASC
jgi:hypothetical protein